MEKELKKIITQNKERKKDGFFNNIFILLDLV